MRLPWYIAAIGAALIWGIHYPLVDGALRRVSIMSVLLLTALPILLVAPFFYRTLAHDLEVWHGLDWGARGALSALALTSLLGSVLVYLSIAGKNATLASLIEISYPLFVALFAYLLFREIQFNAAAAFGAVLVFAGVGLIIVSNP